MKSTAGKFAASIAAASLFASSAAGAAPATAQSLDPLVAVSVFGTSSSQAAVCAPGASPMGANAHCVQATNAPPERAPGSAYAGVGGRSLNVLPLLIGLGAVAAALAIILRNGGDDDIDLPVSPG